MRRALALVVILLLSEISTQATDRQEQVVAALGDHARFLQTLVREPPPLPPRHVSPATRVAVWAEVLAERPSSFRALSITLAALSGLDSCTTSFALKNGHEGNPMLAPIAGNPVALLVAKSAVAAGTVYVTGRLWKRNRAEAIVVMVAANVVTASVVAHNASLIGARR